MADALRVLMVDTVPMGYEGITRVMLNYAGHMSRDGLRLDFAAINDVPASLRAEIDAIGARLFVLEGRNRHPVRYARALAALVRREGYQVVHVHGNSCTMAVELFAARRGGATVRCPHSHNTRTGFPLVNRMLRPMFDRGYTHALACGDAAGQWLYRGRPFTVLNNGVDTARFCYDPEQRAALRTSLGIGDREAVGHVGAFNQQKNHAFLIEAFARAARRDENRVLVLVGDGPERPAIERMVDEKGLRGRVIFTGVSANVAGLLSAMDLMALPSRFEGLPNVVIEWQAAGLPAFVADTVTTQCQLTPLVSFLPLDVDAWAEALLTVPGGDRVADSAAAAHSIEASGFDIRKNAETLRRLYFEYAGVPLPEAHADENEASR